LCSLLFLLDPLFVIDTFDDLREGFLKVEILREVHNWGYDSILLEYICAEFDKILGLQLILCS